MKIVVLDGKILNPGDLSWDALRKLGEVEVYDVTPADMIFERCSGAEAIITNKTPLDREMISRLPELRYIGVLATGYNVVDLAAAKERGIPVTNIPIYGTASVAQATIALLLEFTNRVHHHADQVKAGRWTSSEKWSFWDFPLVELAGKTLGIIGFGRIGRRTAAIAHTMGMRVIARDILETDPPDWEGFRWASLAELLAESDVVSLHCPLFPETEGMINSGTLALMKPTAILLNAARGPLVVDEDLAEALRAGRIAGAGLDVISVEPPPADNPLVSAPNCIITPHIAWATRAARSRLLDTAVTNLERFMKGLPENVVNL